MTCALYKDLGSEPETQWVFVWGSGFNGTTFVIDFFEEGFGPDPTLTAINLRAFRSRP